MTTSEYLKKLDEQYNKIQDAKFIFTCVSNTHASQVQRMFDRGDGATKQIGLYNSTDPIYVSPSASPKKFTPKGKSGSSTFKSGKPHKTGYFDSYKAFRQAISRETSFVNLRLTEDLKNDYTNSLQLAGKVYQSGIKRQENVGKYEGSLDKYGIQTWQLSNTEIENYKECVRLKLYDTINN